MKNHVDMFVGQRILIAREFAGLGEHDLADQIGVTIQELRLYEAGIVRAPASKLSELCHLLGLPAAWFFDGYSGVVERDRLSNEDLIREPSRAQLLEMFERLRNQN